MISHVKGTLTEFLKKCPVTEKTNEMLLEVVLSIMNYSKEEIGDLNDIRKKGKPGSNVSGSAHVETEEDMKGKPKKSIFGMFKKKETSLVRRNTNDILQSPVGPQSRN